MRKEGGVLLTLLLVTVLFASMIPLVSAQGVGGVVSGALATATEVVDATVRALEPLLTVLIGSAATGELFFAKLLFLVIVFGLVWIAVRQFPVLNKYTWVTVLISVAVALLSVRFLSSSAIIDTILLPYSVLGVAVTSLVPLIIYFFFVEKGLESYPILRKIAWIFAAVVFGVLYVVRFNNLGSYAYIYLIAAVLSLIFLWFDGTIRKWFAKSRMDSAVRGSKSQMMRELRRELRKLHKDWREGDYGENKATYRSEVKELESRIIELAG
jgi:hypothetical protein